MKKIFKRFISATLSLALVSGLVPISGTVYADPGDGIWGEGITAIYSTIDSHNDTITFSGAGVINPDGRNMVYDYDLKGAKHVVIESGITGVGGNSFADMEIGRASCRERV